MTWIEIPEDVIVWFRKAFAFANQRSCEAIINTPNIRETTLDDILVTSLIPRSAPTKLRSGAIVRMDIHNIGGLKRLQGWEVADIAIIVHVIKNKSIVARKLGLLQSKRLYPLNNDVDDEDPEGFRYGMNSFLRPNSSPVSMLLERKFAFNKNCHYGALKAKSNQVEQIARFEKESPFKVDYLFYNPHAIPLSILHPVSSHETVDERPKIGCRVLTSKSVRTVLRNLSNGRSPTYEQLRKLRAGGGWRLEYWAADLLLTCKAGKRFDRQNEEQIVPLVERRSGPIGAAIAVHVELPE